VNIFEHIFLQGDGGSFRPRPASRSTAARPGTQEKIAVLAARAQAGEELWHPGDPVIDWEQQQRDEQLPRLLQREAALHGCRRL